MPRGRGRRGGRSTWWRRLITRSRSSSSISTSSAVPPALAIGAANHCSNESADEKILGSMKLSSAQSSCSEFCSGVPVSSSRCADSYCSSVALSFDAAFFMRWPSSTTMYAYWNRLRRCLSFITSSYVVSSTLNLGIPSPQFTSCVSYISRLTSGEPLYATRLIAGAHLRISSCQLESVASGTITRYGPARPFDSIRYEISAIVCAR